MKELDKKYRIRNWSEYNKSLQKRGSINIWFSDDAIEKWLATKSTTRGRPRIYSNDAILCALIIKSVYHLPLRALRGFLQSIVTLLGVDLPIPCYTQICRRAQELGKEISKVSKKRPTDIVIDSTGLKVYGEGEWNARKHGKKKRRTWRKLHLAICPDSHEVILGLLGKNSEGDCQAGAKIFPRLPKRVKRLYGDGAYDTGMCYRDLERQKIKPIIPPQKNGVRHNLKKEPWMRDRNEALEAIKGLGGDEEGRKIWKKLSGYHRRSLAETGMYRFKTIFGGQLRARKLKNQRAESYAKCLAMNKMSRLGMPKGEWITA